MLIVAYYLYLQMVKMDTLYDTWFVPCEIDLTDVFKLSRYIEDRKEDNIAILTLDEGKFKFNTKEKYVMVLYRNPIEGNNFIQKVLSKFDSDENIMYVIKCAKALGYTFFLENKYSN